MSMHYQKSDPIILGSGELYIALAKDIADPENVTSAEEDKFYNIGAIESGATVDISNTYKEIESANRALVAKLKIKTDVRFDTGIMTWNMENISKFLTGATYTDNTTTKERKMVIGKDDNSPVVYLRFVHEKKDDSGDLTVNIYRAMFDGDLNFVFDSENPVTINYEFVGITTDEGNYVEFVETYDQEDVEKGNIIVYYKHEDDILDFKVINKPYGTYTIGAIEIEGYEVDDVATKDVTIDASNKNVTVEFEYKEATE